MNTKQIDIDNKRCYDEVNKLWNMTEEEYFNTVMKNKYSWRIQFIQELSIDKILNNGDMYQVGVFSGSSIKLINKLFNDKGIKFNNIIGFDSFKGLPKENNDKYNSIAWYEGKFNLINNYGNIEKIKNDLFKFINLDNLILVDGLFSDTMNPYNVMKYKMKPASYIDMDCDIYTSTVEALDFFYNNKLLIKGTIIGFDDWSMGNVEKFEYQGGQSKAFFEFCIKYKIKCERLENFKLWKERAVFIINEINY